MGVISEALISEMVKMGFTVYEAKIYLGLLRNNPATGYEISHLVDVPRSVVYNLLRKLESKGIVVSIHDKPCRYIPLSPKQFLSKLELDFSSHLSNLKNHLLEFNNKPETEGFWNIMGYDSLIRTCRSLIDNAIKLVAISGWRREIRELRESLLSAKKRGAEIIIFSFNEIESEYGHVFSYGIDEEKLSELWDHKLILVVDFKDLVMGPANRDRSEQAIWTQNKAVLTIATNYIILDITLFGQRMKQDVSNAVVKLMTERVDKLDSLIKEVIDKKRE